MTSTQNQRSKVADAMSSSSGSCLPKCCNRGPPFSFSDMPQPPPIKFASLPPGITITRKEFDIFKLTAQFVSVYGMYFRRALKKRVCENPLFEFLNPTDSRHGVYLKLAIGYSHVLVPSKKLMTYQKYITNFDDATEEVLDSFFKLLDQLLEKKEEEDGVEMAMTDFHAFEYFANVERTVLLPPPPGLVPNLVLPLTDLRSRQNHPETTSIMASNVNDDDDDDDDDDAQDIKPDVPASTQMKTSWVADAWSRSSSPCHTFSQPDAPALKCCHLAPPFRSSRMPQPPPIKFAYLPPGITITRKEFDIFKLTAQFVAVYGMYFRRALTKRVCENPLFEFFKPTDIRHRCFLKLVIGYSNVLEPSKKLMTNQKYITNFNDATEEVLDGFFKLLDQVPEKEMHGVEMAMTDLRAFEYFANVERTVLPPPPSGLVPNLVKLETLLQLQHAKNQIRGMKPTATPNPMQGMSSPPPPLSLPEEPEPKKPESALVPEDQFIAQHPGSYTIKVSIPSIGDGKVIEIKVQSLLENVASFKEKIAGEIHIPVMKQELSGKAGLLKDNKSLAHYNVRAGETLTLSLRALM